MARTTIGNFGRNAILAGTSLAAMIAFASPASAQTEQADQADQESVGSAGQDYGEIIVTATKREQTLQEVPFSINAQTEEQIQRSGATTVEDLSRNVAGLAVQNLGPGQSQVSVRGVSAGQIVRDQPGVKEQVGVYLDESVISLSLFTPDVDLFDLNRVETLRGPQGTLFGSGSVGGTIRYITNAPVLGTVEGVVEGNVNLVDEDDFGGHIKGAVNVPLGDTAAVRAVAYGTRYGGFIDALGPAGGKNVNDGSRVGGRLSVLFQPTEDISITPRVVYQQIRVDGFNREDRYNLYRNKFLLPAQRIERRQQYLMLREEFQDDFLLGDLTASVGLGAVALTSVTSYINRDILVSRDASALTASVGISPLAGAGVDPDIALLPSNLRDTTDLEQWSQELRLSSTGDGPLQWVLGGFYSDVKRGYSQRLPTPGYDALIDAALGAGASAGAANGFPANSPYNADLPYDITQRAVFGEATYDFGQVELTAGGRYYDFEETRDFISGGVFANGDTRIGDTTKSDGFSPRVIASFEASEDLRFNVQVAKGFRLGGVNDPLNIPLCSGGAGGIDALTYGNRPTYEDETLWNYEGGVKYQGRGISFNAAAFYNDIKNLQVTADAGSCSSRVVFNVSNAHSIGLEAEFTVSPTPGLDLSLAGSLVDAEFDSNVRTAGGDIIAGIRAGNRLPTVPKFQAAASATYGERFGGNAEWFVSSTLQHVGDRFTQQSDQEVGAGNFNFVFYNPATGAFGTQTANFGSLRLPSYNLLNFSMGVEFDSGLELIAYANNIFDTTPLLSLDRERGGRARLGFNVGQPRTFGVTARKRF